MNDPKPPDDTTIAQLASLSAEERQVLLKVSEILKRLQFGTVLLVVQDVVLNKPWPLKAEVGTEL